MFAFKHQFLQSACVNAVPLSLNYDVCLREYTFTYTTHVITWRMLSLSLLYLESYRNFILRHGFEIKRLAFWNILAVSFNAHAICEHDRCGRPLSNISWNLAGGDKNCFSAEKPPY
jgi:hypothetical protein